MKFIKKYWLFIIIAFVLSIFINPGLCFLILGSIVFFMGFEALVLLRRIQKNGIKCNGTIVAFETDNDGYKTPIIEFSTLTGVLIKEKPFVYSTTDLSRIGIFDDMTDKSVFVLYDSDSPEKFVIESDNELNNITFVFLILGGLIFIILGVCRLLGYIKH